MKTRLGYEILLIVGFSIIAGLSYHAIMRDSKTRLPWIREHVVLTTADDNELFGVPENQNQTKPMSVSVSDAQHKEKQQTDTASSRNSSSKLTHEQVTSSIPTTTEGKRESEQIKKAVGVSYKQVLRLNSDETVMFFDARNEHEFAEGTIPRAKNIFPLEFEKHIPYILGIPKDTRIVVFCGGGQCDLSHDLSDKLIQFGFSKVYIYLGGYTEWKAKQTQQ